MPLRLISPTEKRTTRISGAFVERASKRLEQLALRRERWARTEEKLPYEALNIAPMLYRDAKDFRQIAKYLNARQFSKALNKIIDMDTDPREEIPLYVFQTLAPGDYD